MLLAIQRHERRALWHGLHHNLVTLHHIGIEGMQGLTKSHHHVVRNVHDIVDRTQANSSQLILQPIGRFLHLTASHADTSIALAGLGVLDDHVDGQVVIVNDEIVGDRFVGSRLVAILLQPGIQVASHAPMTQGIGTVSCDVHLDEPIALQMVILGSRCTNHGILR